MGLPRPTRVLSVQRYVHYGSAMKIEADIEAILARRHANGGDYWATPDGRIYVGNPFSTIAALGMLYELDLDASHEAVRGGLDLILDASMDDGRIRVAPKSPLYPCYTAEAARMLCRFGLADHAAVQQTVAYLIDNMHEGGGWRCNFTKFGRGPETLAANPGATLYALDVLRFFPAYRAGHDSIDHAVEFLLQHWETRQPLGPCHWGIGTMFLQVEFPFLRYNLFYYLYVLSFYERAAGDPRFASALSVLASKLDEKGRVIVERPHRALTRLKFCAKGAASEPATVRYREMLANLDPAWRGRSS